MANTTHIEEIITYIKIHPVMVVGTVDDKGRPHGSAVYVYTQSLDTLYFITKTETRKFKHIQENPYVSLTTFDAKNNSSLAITGHAAAVHNAEVIEKVMDSMTKIYSHTNDWLPPIAKFRAGPYQVVAVKLQRAKLAQYMFAHPGDEHIFKEVDASDL